MKLTNEEYKRLEDLVYKFPTKYDIGFTKEEEDKLLELFPDINTGKYINALRGITCQIRDGKIVTYHCDILKALICGIEDRDLKYWEWD